MSENDKGVVAVLGELIDDPGMRHAGYSIDLVPIRDAVRELIEEATKAAQQLEDWAVKIDGEWGSGRDFAELVRDNEAVAQPALRLRTILTHAKGGQ